jgi:hypothetical protein
VPASHIHKYGGTPSNGAMLPTCRNCGKSLHLLLQVDLSDQNLDYLKLSNMAYLFVLTCLNCLSYMKPTYYRLENGSRKVVLLKDEPRKCVDNYPRPLDEHAVSYRPLRNDEYPITEDGLFRLLDMEGKHQLGGTPVWVQGEEQIACIDCGNEMDYIAMVDSELYTGEDGFRTEGHMFGDEGILYVFVCRRCGILATKAQSF